MAEEKIINVEWLTDRYEDDIVKVILDAYPDANGHTLIIPKKHITDIDEMDNETLGHINDVAKKIRKLLFNTMFQDVLASCKSRHE